jgi:hypothetical protein
VVIQVASLQVFVRAQGSIKLFPRFVLILFVAWNAYYSVR